MSTTPLLTPAQILARLNALGAVGAAFADDVFAIKGSSDGTKKVRFEVDGLTTATTRVVTVPDADLTLTGSASALTSGRVPFATTGGVLTDSANLTYGSGTFKVNDSTASSSTTTGAIVATGGVGIGGALNVAGSTTLAAVAATTMTSSGQTTLGTGALVGIGSAPTLAHKLQVDAGSAADDCLALVSTRNVAAAAVGVEVRHNRGAGTSANGDAITLVTGRQDDSTTANAVKTSIKQIIEDVTHATVKGAMAFFTSGTTVGFERMRISGSGNVLIASTTDDGTNKLQVTGAAKVTGALSVTDTTASTTPATGALVVAGGVGIGGALYVGSTSSTDVVVGLTSSKTANVANTCTIDFKLQDNAAASVEYGYIQSVSSRIIAGAHSGELRFGVGYLGTVPVGMKLVGDKGTGDHVRLVIGANATDDTLNSLQVYGSTSLAGTTDSSSTTTGALIVAGGVGIAKSLTVGTGATITHSATALNLLTSDSGTTNEPNVLVIDHATSGTPGFGFGTRIAFNAQSTTTTGRNQALILAQWETATDASRASSLWFYTYDTGARECMRMGASGSAPMIGFLGTTPIVRPTGTTDIRGALINLGLYASGGASPLDLNGGLLTAGTAAITVTDAGTTTQPDQLTIGHNSSGTPSTGFGTAIRFIAADTTNNDQWQGLITSEWRTASHASRKARMTFNVFDQANVAREGLRIESDGSNAKVGFFGASGSPQQTPGGVTAGFTAGGGTAMNSASTSTGNSGLSAYTFGDVVVALKLFGLLAT